MRHCVPADPRALARAALSLTALSWGIERGLDPDTSEASIGAIGPRPTSRHPASRGPTPAGRRAPGVDVTADQWPYWPTYPGLAAHWR